MAPPAAPSSARSSTVHCGDWLSEKSAIRALNAEPVTKTRQTRVRPSLYDEAGRASLIVLWETSDRVCRKRLRALLPILPPALERYGHLHLAEPIREKTVVMIG